MSCPCSHALLWISEELSVGMTRGWTELALSSYSYTRTGERPGSSIMNPSGSGCSSSQEPQPHSALSQGSVLAPSRQLGKQGTAKTRGHRQHKQSLRSAGRC